MTSAGKPDHVIQRSLQCVNKITGSFRLILIVSVFALVSAVSHTGISEAQTKVGYIDSKRIIEGMQESADAKQRLDNLVATWQGELKVLQDSLKLMKEDYDKKKLILTDQLRKDKEEQISGMEKAVTDYRVQKFGEGGEYFVKQTEFMKPVYDRIFKAIEDVAKDGGYDYVFDRSSDILLLYVNETHDLTAKVIRVMEER